MNELDYMESLTLTEDSSVTLNPYQNMADQYFGINKDIRGVISINPEQKEEDPEESLSSTINNEIRNSQNILAKLKQDNKNTKLTDSQLLDMYNSINGDGFVIF